MGRRKKNKANCLVQNLNCIISISFQYESLFESGALFPCYPSSSDRRKVLEKYNFRDSLHTLLTVVAVPNGIFFVSLAILLFWCYSFPFSPQQNAFLF